MRTAKIERKTKETDIVLSLNLDGVGSSTLDTGCGFLNHMLELFAKHGRFDLQVSCKGDVEVDYHHTVEDIGIALGEAFSKALGDKKGIKRYGTKIIPMDESLVMSAVDLSGRCAFVYNLNIPTQKVGDFDTELVEEFWVSFARNVNCNLHINEFYGKNSHHIIECAFKCVARSLKEAVSYGDVIKNTFACVGESLKEAVEIDQDFKDEVPSTKGVL